MKTMWKETEYWHPLFILALFNKNTNFYLVRRWCCQKWTTRNGIHTNKNKNQMCRKQDPNDLNWNVLYPLTSVSLSSLGLIMQHSSPTGIWPQDWGGQRGICDWEGPSFPIRHPLTRGRDDQSASDLCSQGHHQLRKRKHKKPHKLFK